MDTAPEIKPRATRKPDQKPIMLDVMLCPLQPTNVHRDARFYEAFFRVLGFPAVETTAGHPLFTPDGQT